jgi:osmotically-inducible protein OsmY
VPGDDEITARVKDLLRIDAATSTLDLDVETVDGVVYLRGTVLSLEDTDLAAEVAARVPGVVDVVDEMTVQE